MSEVADVFDDYVKIKDIFALIDIHSNNSLDKNFNTSFFRAVCTAMDSILGSLSKPIQFMTSDKY
jgi:hypothetical protein